MSEPNNDSTLITTPVTTDSTLKTEVTAKPTQTDKQSPISHFGDKLQQWQPGQSGNPAGRPPKEKTITSLVKEYLDKKDDRTGKTYAQLVAEAMVKGALKDPQVLRELLNRCEGKVTEQIDMQTQGVSILYEMVKPREDAQGTG